MRVQLLTRSLVGLAVLFTLSAPAAAQSSGGDVGISFSVLRDQDIEEVFPLGWVAAAAVHINDWLGAVGEVGGNYKSIDAGGVNVDLSVHTFLGGFRVSGGRSGSITPFGQILVGIGRAKGGALGISASDTGLALQPGAGLDVSISKGLAIRLQGDYRAIRNEGEIGSELRFAGGLVFVF